MFRLLSTKCGTALKCRSQRPKLPACFWLSTSNACRVWREIFGSLQTFKHLYQQVASFGRFSFFVNRMQKSWPPLSQSRHFPPFMNPKRLLAYNILKKLQLVPNTREANLVCEWVITFNVINSLYSTPQIWRSFSLKSIKFWMFVAFSVHWIINIELFLLNI